MDDPIQVELYKVSFVVTQHFLELQLIYLEYILGKQCQKHHDVLRRHVQQFQLDQYKKTTGSF